MTEPSNTITSRPTHVNDQEIVATEPAIGPHPRWPDRLVPRAGVTKALLADGSEVYLCDGGGKTVCHFVGDNPTSVVSHRNGTHQRVAPRGSLYGDTALRQIVGEVEKAKRAKVRGYAEAAAKALNASDVKTIHGGPWTASAVSGIYRAWGATVKVRIPKPSTVTQRAAAKVRAANGHVETDDLQALRSFIVLAQPLAQALQRLLERLEDRPGIDPELVEKARRYDELRGLIGR